MKAIFKTLKRQAMLVASLSILITPLAAQPSKTLLQGRVMGKDKIPLQGANVLLLNETDSVCVAACISGADGRFSFSAYSKRYILVTSLIGYIRSRLVVDATVKLKVDVGDVCLKMDDYQLSGVTVVGQRAFIRYQAGKCIVYPNGNVAGSHGNVYELLKGIPGLVLHEDGTILLNGQKGVNLMINGKETFLSGESLVSLLKTTVSSSVDGVEVMTTPSSEYDASGKAGVINIKLKRSGLEGTSIAFWAGIQQSVYLRKDVWTRAAFRKARSGFAIEASHYSGSRTKQGRLERVYTPESCSSGIFSSQSLGLTYKDNTNNIRFTTDADLSKYTTIDTYFSASFFQRDTPGSSFASYYKLHSQIDSSMQTITNSSYLQRTFRGGVRAIYTGNKQQNGSIAVDGLFFDHTESSNLASSVTKKIVQKDERDSLLGDVNSCIRMLAILGHYSFTLSPDIQFQAGGKASVVNIDSKAIYKKCIRNSAAINPQFSSYYTYWENNYAGYVQLVMQKKWGGVQAGLRLESTHIDGTTYDVNNIYQDTCSQISYYNLFPSVNVSVKLDANSDIAIGYNRRINRPNYKDLCPLSYMVDERVVLRGNPTLQAELSSNMELTYIYKKNSRLSVFYSYTSRAISQGFYSTSGTNLIVIPENLASNSRRGLRIDLSNIVNISWWQISFSGTVVYMENRWRELLQKKRSSQLSPMANINSNFLFSNSWNLQVSGYYNGVVDLGQISIPHSWSMNASIRKKVRGDKLSFVFFVNDIFSSIRERSVFRVSNIEGYSDVRYSETCVGVGVNFLLNRGKTKENVDRSIDESKRINL